MFESMTKMLEKVDAQATQIAVEDAARQQQQDGGEGGGTSRSSSAPVAAATADVDHDHHASSSPTSAAAPPRDATQPGSHRASGSDLHHHHHHAALPTTSSSSSLPASSPPPAPPPLPSEADRDPSRARAADAQAHRDQTVLRLQRDYDDVAARSRDLARELERREEELDSAVTERHRLDRELAEVREAFQRKESRSAEVEDEVAALQAALTDANSGADALRQDRDIAVAQRRQWETQSRQAQEALDDFKRKSAAAISGLEKRLEDAEQKTAAAQQQQQAKGEDATSSSTPSGSPTGQLQTRLVEAESRLADLATQLTAACSEAAEAKSAADRAKREAVTAAKKAADAVEETRVAQAMYDGESASHQSTRSRLEAALKDAQDESKALQKQLAASRSSASAAAGGGEGGSTSTAGGMPAGAAGAGEWERRARELAELLVEKQAALEARRSEADQWKARYESAQQKIRELELVSLSAASGGAAGAAGASGLSHRAINMGGGHQTSGSGTGADTFGRDHAEAMMGEFGRSQFFGNLSRRGNFGRQVVSAAQQVDSLSLHAGRMLRRSSVLRVAVIVYVIVLQLWAFFAVALTSVPDTAAAANQAPPTA